MARAAVVAMTAVRTRAGLLALGAAVLAALALTATSCTPDTDLALQGAMRAPIVR